MDPSKRFVTLVLGAGVIVLVSAILIGRHMGDRVLDQASSSGPAAMPVVITPAPTATEPGPYSPDWKREQTLAAPTDPAFPDPRIPPKPLPTLPPETPKPRPSATAAPTYNPNIPIWDQTPLPGSTTAPSPSPSLMPNVVPSASEPPPAEPVATPQP